MLLPDLLDAKIELELLLITKPGKNDLVSVRGEAGRNLKSGKCYEGNDGQFAGLYWLPRPQQKAAHHCQQQ
jgi:hypothetical protein